MLKLASCPCHFFTLRNSCLHTDSPVSILSPFSTRNPMTQVHYYSKYVAKYESVCVEKKNKLDVTEWFFALIICSTCFGHIYAQHQELETTCVLLPPMECGAWLLVAGGQVQGSRLYVQEEGCCTTEWFIALIICSTCFGHIYAHHQELETIRVLLPPMVCGAWLLVVGGQVQGSRLYVQEEG